MPEEREYRTEAIVIRKTKLGEADSIITFFTPHRGRIQGFAKSLRKPKSKLAGHLELLTYSQVSFARGRNIDTITGAQTIDAFLPLRNNLWLSSCGLYVAELVYHFTPEGQENFTLFRLTLDTLRRLCRGEDTEVSLRFFELHLAEGAGYRPELDTCVNCRSALAETTNFFSPQAGGMLCPSCRQMQPTGFPVSPAAQGIMRHLQRAEYPAIPATGIDPESLHEVEKISGAYLKYLLEKDVRSAAWLEMLKKSLG
ncbi:MAG: DNA repair protein RecO [Dehalococcoidales bacterium]|nr:DNA repair protein RecO [Dehalococcoidales bacterium]